MKFTLGVGPLWASQPMDRLQALPSNKRLRLTVINTNRLIVQTLGHFPFPTSHPSLKLIKSVGKCFVR
jgi:hypothetical protein